MWITITDKEGTVLERWYTEGDPAEVYSNLDRRFVLASDPDDYAFLTED